MAYTFKKEFYPTFSIYISDREPIEKATAPEALLLRKLRAFLDANEPELVYFLMNTWRHQGKAITYKEIREALLLGELTQEYLEEWQEDYTRFVTEYMRPAWLKAMEAANADRQAKYKEWFFDPYADGIRQWTEAKSAEFVTNVSRTQIEGLRTVVMRAANLEDMTVDGLSRAIRAMVGLTEPQTRANLNYYTKLIESGTTQTEVAEKVGVSLA